MRLAPPLPRGERSDREAIRVRGPSYRESLAPSPQPSPLRGEGARRVRGGGGASSQMLFEKPRRQVQRALGLRLGVGLAAETREGVVGAGIFVDRHQRIG